jgi:hypothetical protein
MSQRREIWITGGVFFFFVCFWPQHCIFHFAVKRRKVHHCMAFREFWELWVGRDPLDFTLVLDLFICLLPNLCL